jgi:hypothetical protein
VAVETDGAFAAVVTNIIPSAEYLTPRLVAPAAS